MELQEWPKFDLLGIFAKFTAIFIFSGCLMSIIKLRVHFITESSKVMYFVVEFGQSDT